MALAQRQFYYVSTFFAGLVAGAVVAYFIGYNDLVRHHRQVGAVGHRRLR